MAKKRILRILALLLALLALPAPQAQAASQKGSGFQADLSSWIKNENRREYMEMMLDYHVRCNSMVVDALEGGFAAVFLFDGCSDNMDDPELQDLTYYRVTGVCIVLGKNGSGEITVRYVNENASTIPDRPLEYGAWSFPEVGAVGPATVRDGTYQLYSVRHKGDYEALHLRTEYTDATLDAVYMVPDGFVNARATEINIHTRTSNHTASRGMWSAGCPLVGAGKSWEFSKLIESTYYRCYEEFEVDNFVGCVTIDRMGLRRAMETLYESTSAVNHIILASQELQPEQYLKTCQTPEALEAPEERKAAMNTSLMTLPCSNDTDARSRQILSVPKGKTLRITGRIVNHLGNEWLEAEYDGESGYVYSGHVLKYSWLEKTIGFLFG